jgi:hypothetical protein
VNTLMADSRRPVHPIKDCRHIAEQRQPSSDADTS